MSFGLALLFGIAGAVYTTTIAVYWLDKFKVNISGKTIIHSLPILGIAITIFNLLASDDVLIIALFVCLAIAIITCGFHWIWVLIDKRK